MKEIQCAAENGAAENDRLNNTDEKIFDCVIIHRAVFKSLLSREYERRIDKRKKTLPVIG